MIGFFHYSVLPPVQSTINSCIRQYKAFRLKKVKIFPAHLTGLSRAVHPSWKTYNPLWNPLVQAQAWFSQCKRALFYAQKIWTAYPGVFAPFAAFSYSLLSIELSYQHVLFSCFSFLNEMPSRYEYLGGCILSDSLEGWKQISLFLFQTNFAHSELIPSIVVSEVFILAKQVCYVVWVRVWTFNQDKTEQLSFMK